MNTKIKKARFYRAVSRITKPIADSTHTISKIAFYVTEVETADGVRGQGYLLSFHYSPNAIEGALKDCCNFILDKEYNVYQTVLAKKEWDMEAEYFGNTGLNTCAIAAFNVAMWDAWGHCNGQPVHKLLGCNQDRIPVYGSGGWISYTDEELLEEVLDYKSRGFTAVKIKVGHPDGIERDLHRLGICREKLGSGVKIMMDANQGMDVVDALKLSEQAKEIGLQWFEEPVPHTDFAGYGLLRQKCGIALEEWRNSAALASAYQLPVLPHYYKDYDVPLLCTIARPYGAESFDWIDGIIDNTMRIEDGYAYPREGAGWGFRFKEEALEEVR